MARLEKQRRAVQSRRRAATIARSKRFVKSSSMPSDTRFCISLKFDRRRRFQDQVWRRTKSNFFYVRFQIVEIARLESIVQYMIKLELLQWRLTIIIITWLNALTFVEEAWSNAPEIKEEKQLVGKQQPPPNHRKRSPKNDARTIWKIWEAYPAKKTKEKHKEKFWN